MHGDDYYEPHPSLRLHRPLVLTGHPAAGVHPIGRAIAGRTGLAFNDIERATESGAGRSRARIWVEQGVEALRDLEAEALAKALRRRPYGVVVMETGLLEREDVRALLVRHATTIHIERPLEVLFWRVVRRCAEAPGSLPEFLVGPPRRPEQLGDYLAPREAHIGELDGVLGAGDRHPSRLAGELVAMLRGAPGPSPVEHVV